MTGFWLRRLYIIKGGGLSLSLRAMRARLARQRMVNRRVMQSVIASQVAAEQMEEQNRRIREAMDLRCVADALDDLWVLDCLFEVENDPRIRRINSQNPATRNTPSMNRARTFTGRRRRPSQP